MIHPSVIRGAATLLLRRDPFGSDQQVIATLRQLAEPLVDALALNEVQYALNKEFVDSLSIGASPRDAAQGLLDSASASQRRVAGIEVSNERFEELIEVAVRKFRAALTTDEFLTRFPGDRLLRALSGHLGVTADHFRNACLDQAQRLALRPQGMEAVLREAIN